MDSLGVARLILIVANTINNTDISGLNGLTANIDGTYILQKLLSASLGLVALGTGLHSATAVAAGRKT